MKIRVGLSQTIKLGEGNSFEFIKPSVEVEDELQKTGGVDESTTEWLYETPEECYDRLSKLCHKLLYQEILKFEQQAENNKFTS